MHIYLVDGATGNLRDAAKSNPTRHMKFLLSFYYYRLTNLDKQFGSFSPRLMADSGAFSATTMGATISIHEYAAWIKTWEHLFDSYANLDVIGNAQATLDNQRRLEDMGLRPLPVFHVNEPWEYLEYYLEHYDYIALGGLVGIVHAKGMMPWLIKAFQMLSASQRYHGFGMTSWEMLMNLPWGSVDSTSWASGYRYGRIPMFSTRLCKFVYATLGDTSSCFQWRHLFELHGFDWLDFADRSRYDRRKVIQVSANAYLNAEEWLTKRYNQSVPIYLAGLAQSDCSNVKGMALHV